MKVTVIGGGSTYTPELLMGFLALTQSFPLSELWLMDIDGPRLKIVGEFAQRIASARRAPFRVILSQDQRETVRGAKYVITQLRVGQMAARREDEYLGLRHGLVGQETTGIGGMAKALRTIPVILRLAGDMQELAPGALLVNFTNPAGLITQALQMAVPDLPAVGVCNVAITTKMNMLAGLEKQTGRKFDPAGAELDTLGLNHLTWHRGLQVEGRDYWPEILQGAIAELRTAPNPEFPPELLETLGMIPNYYLQYYYSTQHKLEEQSQWPPSRAETVIEVEKDLLAAYARPELNQPPDDLMKRGGAYYSTAATRLLDAHFNDRAEIHVLNLPHGSAVPGWPADWVLEMPCRVDGRGVHPLPAKPLPEVCYGLLAWVKMAEMLTARAALSGDRSLLFQALLAHPLGPQVEKIEAVMADLLTTHRRYLPQFWKE